MSTEKPSQETTEVIRTLMEALKKIQLPRRLKKWNCIIQVELVQESGDIRYQWLIRDGQLHIQEGTTHKPDYLIREKPTTMFTEGEPPPSLYYATGGHKGELNMNLSVAMKYGALIGEIRKFLSNQHPDIKTEIQTKITEHQAREAHVLKHETERATPQPVMKCWYCKVRDTNPNLRKSYQFMKLVERKKVGGLVKEQRKFTVTRVDIPICSRCFWTLVAIPLLWVATVFGVALGVFCLVSPQSITLDLSASIIPIVCGILPIAIGAGAFWLRRWLKKTADMKATTDEFPEIRSLIQAGWHKKQ